MNEPKILLSAAPKAEFYIDAVNESGGVAVLREGQISADGFDGLILCGGSDIHPKFYGEAIDGAVKIDTVRDEAELALTEAFLAAGKPILGICRGCQLLNVFFGGSLCQDLPNASAHTSYGGEELSHAIRAEEGSLLHGLYGAEFQVNSAHHQAVARLGEGLRVTARADEVAEAIEHGTLPVIGVQWHPERMSFRRRRADTVDGAPLFAYFLSTVRGDIL